MKKLLLRWLLPSLDAWVQHGVDEGWAYRNGHVSWDDGWVKTLVLRTPDYEARKG